MTFLHFRFVTFRFIIISVNYRFEICLIYSYSQHFDAGIQEKKNIYLIREIN